MAHACARCRLLNRWGVNGQAFHDDDNGYIYDVEQARAIIARTKRLPITVPSHEAYKVCLRAGINLKHVQHVDIRFPSIAIRYKGNWIFIDGNHRVFARLCRMLPVKAYPLTAQEARSIRTKKPTED